MGQAIQGTLGQDRIVEEGDPLLHRAVAGEDRGGAPVAFDDDLVDVARLGRIEPPQAEIVDDEQVRREQAAQGLLAGVIGLGLVEFPEHRIGTQEEHAMPGTAGRVTETAREQGLPHADGSEEQDILGFLQEAEAEEIAHPVPIEGDGSFPVKVLQGTDLLEARLLQAEGEVVLFAAVDLILQDQLQEILGSQVRLLGVGHPVGQCGQDSRELQAFEDGFQ